LFHAFQYWVQLAAADRTVARPARRSVSYDLRLSSHISVTTARAAASDYFARQGLQGLQGFRAAQGLHGFFAAHGLHGLARAAHGFFAAQGLHGLHADFLAAQGLQGLQAAIWTESEAA
jgi:hypothetical protein